MATIEELHAAAALELGLGPADPRVIRAADAAVALAEHYCHGSAPIVTPTPLLELPLAFAGLVPLTVRLVKDPAAPAGLLESDAYTGTALPADLLAHLHHYFDPFRSVTDGAFGIA